MKKLFNKKDIKIILACFSLVIVVLFYFFYIYDRKDYYICKESDIYGTVKEVEEIKVNIDAIKEILAEIEPLKP